MPQKQEAKNSEKVNTIFRLVSSVRERVHQGSLDTAMQELIQALRLYCGTQVFRKEKELLEEQFYDLELKLSSHPKFITTYGPVSFVKGQHEMTIDFLSQLIGLEAESFEEKFTRFRMFLDNGLLDEAALVAQEIIDYPEVKLKEIIAIGDCYFKKNYTKEAQDAYQIASKKYSNSIHAINRMAILLRKNRQFQESLEYYQRAIRLSPRDEGIYYNLARLFLEWGKQDKAIQALENALTINPEFEEAKKLMIEQKKPK